MEEKKLFISIAGLIGAGKTTLSNSLSNRLNLPIYHEPVEENPYLKLFYEDMSSVSFSMQIYLLGERFKQQQQINWSSCGGVSDRSIYEDSIFANMLTKSNFMSELDLSNYKNIFNIMTNMMKHPDIIIFLDVFPEEALKRIKERGREFEKSITLEYLKALEEEYKIFIEYISKTIPVLRLDWNEYQDIDIVVEKIINGIKNLNKIYDI